MINIPICYKYVNLINPEKKNQLAKYIIFTSVFQINLIPKCTQILIDGTFRACPKGYYQIVNISGYYPDINGIIPLFMSPITGKSEFLYDNLFEDIIKIIESKGIKIKDITANFMVDFEKSLINSIKKKFDSPIIDGCFFHFSKLLWKKAKAFGLCKRNNLKNTKILIFMLKLIPFLNIDKRSDLFNKIKEYYKEPDGNYSTLVNYFEKNWINNPYINYCELTNKEFLNRTNNYQERFHKTLNSLIECYHPKLSFLIDKYKNYIRFVYEKIKKSLINKIEEKVEKFSVVNDILLFIKRYKDLYNTDIDIINIIQNNNEVNDIIEKVCNYMLENLNDFSFVGKENEENDYNDNDLSIDTENEIKEESNNIINENNSEFLSFNEIYPFIKTKDKGKRNHNEIVDESNELKIFLEHLQFPKIKEKLI